MRSIKRPFVYWAVPVVAALLAGCATAPVMLGMVGPNPNVPPAYGTTDGHLEVYSARQRQHDDQEFDPAPAWYQHTDYVVCDSQGHPQRHVFNTTGHYSQSPATISLPPGKYIIQARAKDYLTVTVPVEIKPGQTTRVHLDGRWVPPTGTPAKELARTPGGSPIGWSDQS